MKDDDKRANKSGGGKRWAYPKGRQLEPVARDEIRQLLGDRPRNRDLLIEHLHLIQDHYGHISAANLTALAGEMNMAQSEVYEVASFYHHFDIIKEDQTPPPALTIRICDGVVCQCAGANQLLDDMAGAVSADVRVVAAPCVGACNHAPVAVVGQHQVKKASVESVVAAVESGRTKEAIPETQNLATYEAEGGYAIFRACQAGERNRDDVIQEIEDSELRGMGGAGFPTGRKWKFLGGTSQPRVLVVNADEGEPGTFKDRWCLERTPHRFLEGVLIAAWAIEAADIYIYVRDEYPACRDILAREIAALEKIGLTAPGYIHLRRGAGAYICGEEGALLDSLEGKRGLPRNRPPYPAQSGLFGRPTLINNVETLYWVPAVLAQGAAWYREAGHPRLYSVSGRVNNPGVIEAPNGVTARQLIDEYCGGMADGHALHAFLPGGASGGILPADKADLPLAFGALDEYGCFVGSGAVVIFSDQDSVQSAVINLIKFFADESCGQCTPCRVGCEKLVLMLEQDNWDAKLISELSTAMRDASICGLGQAAPNPILAAQRFFPELSR